MPLVDPFPQQRRTLRLAVLAVAAVVALGCAAGPKSTVVDGPSGSPGAVGETARPTAKLGQSIEVSGGIGDNRITFTVRSAAKRSAAPDAAWIKPRKGVFLAIDVEVKVTKGKTYACFCDFALVASDGTLYEPVLAFGFDAAMQSVTLNEGEKASGVVVFDLPEAAPKGGRVQLRPDIANDIRGYWQL